MDEKTREMLDRLFDTFSVCDVDQLRLLDCVIQCILQQKFDEGDE